MTESQDKHKSSLDFNYSPLELVIPKQKAVSQKATLNRYYIRNKELEVLAFYGLGIGMPILGSWAANGLVKLVSDSWEQAQAAGIAGGILGIGMGIVGYTLASDAIRNLRRENLGFQPIEKNKINDKLEETQTIEIPQVNQTEVPQIKTIYEPIKVTRKNPLGIGHSLSFGDIERSNILTDLMSRLANYVAQHGRQMNYAPDEPKITVNGIKVDRILFETEDGVISGSIRYFHGSWPVGRDRIVTVAHFNSDDETNLNEYMGLYKLIEGLSSKDHSKDKVTQLETPKNYEGQGIAPAAR